ncbi:MAG TPA: hypothetical protein VFJ82_27150 [Longimicrobium sp.]|nr:hypothetical protein [Longimicrobium sp.]
MHRTARLLLAIAAPLALLVSGGCNDDGTGPENILQLTPGQARPYGVVEVTDLPAAYAGATSLEITVGGQRSVLVYDPVRQTHHFAVPQLAPGRAEVVIPAVQGGKKVTASLEVLPAEYLGGSPDAALARMDGVLDSVQVSAATALRTLSPQSDSALYNRLDVSLALAEALQQAADTVSPGARATLAAIFSQHAADFELLAGSIARAVAQLDSVPPLAGASLRMSSAPVSADVLVRRCQARVTLLEQMSDLTKAVEHVALLVNVTLLLVAPEAFPVVALMSAKLVMALDIAVTINNLVPDLLASEGLRLQVNPARIRHDGGTGEMTAFVRLVPSGEVLESGVGIAMGLAAPIAAYKDLKELRELTLTAFRWQALKGLGIDELIGRVAGVLDKGIRDYTDRHLGGETPVTFDGVHFTAGTSGHWEFTGPAAGTSRGLRTVGQVQGIETVQLAAALGSGSRCTAHTAGSTPALGINGFEIASAASLKLAPGGTVTVRAGGSASATLSIRNEGGDTARAITYRLADPVTGAFTPPAWLQVQLGAGPATLLPQASGVVRLSVQADVDAPERSVVVPVAAVLNGKIVTVATVTVEVDPQLSDVVVNREQSSIRLWDHGQQDGDLVTVTLNGAALATGHSLTNAGTVFPVQYRRGRNVLIIRALNEGSLSPNTASVGLADVVRGVGTQAYELPTGGVATLTITYDPNATAVRAPGSAAPPPARLRACGAGVRGDCVPR